MLARLRGWVGRLRREPSPEDRAAEAESKRVADAKLSLRAWDRFGSRTDTDRERPDDYRR
jgi:hypothetical protein